MNTTDPTGTTGAAVRRFDTICVIFNPHSTGNAAQLAGQLRDQLVEGLPYTPDIPRRPATACSRR